MYSQSWRPARAPSPMSFGYPVFWMPLTFAAPCEQVVVHEIEADATTPSKSALIGGRGESRLTVEYFVASGASAPAVNLTITTGGQTTTWNDTNVAAGYHVHEGLAAVHAGTMVTLAAANLAARLRWCETVCC